MKTHKIKLVFLAAKYMTLKYVTKALMRVNPRAAHRLMIHLFNTPERLSAPPVQQKWMDSTEKKTVDVDGVKIQLYIKGEGPLVLLSHGWTGRAAQHHLIADALVENNFKIIAWDMHGHGQSGGRECNPKLVLNALDAIGREYGPFHGHIAHSIGGVAALVGTSHELPVTKLTTISTPSQFDTVIRRFFESVLDVNADHQEIRRLFTAKVGITPEKYFPAHSKPRPDDLKLLVIHDEDDAFIPFSEARLLHGSAPGATLLATQGLGHDGPLKDAKVIEACLKHLLSE